MFPNSLLPNFDGLLTANNCQKDMQDKISYISKFHFRMGRPGETEEERRIRKDKERKRRREKEKLKEGHSDDKDSRKKFDFNLEILNKD